MANPLAIFETSMGSFTVEVFQDQMPITSNNFMDLAKSGFYDGLHFHRVISDLNRSAVRLTPGLRRFRIRNGSPV